MTNYEEALQFSVNLHIHCVSKNTGPLKQVGITSSK